MNYSFSTGIANPLVQQPSEMEAEDCDGQHPCEAESVLEVGSLGGIEPTSSS